jgi:hypothetical protein
MKKGKGKNPHAVALGRLGGLDAHGRRHLATLRNRIAGGQQVDGSQTGSVAVAAIFQGLS